jgi:hypothetical protein
MTTIPNSKLLVSYLDFDTIKVSLRDYLRSQTQFQDYDFDGAGLSVLLDILAYNTHYNAFYMNMIANEMFIDSANLRSSVVSLAKMVNYTPRSVTSAQAQVSIVITPNDSAASAVIEENSTFSSNVDGTVYTFITNQAYGATIQNGVFTFPNVTLLEGVPYTYRITVDSTVPNQRFLLPNPNIDTSQLVVRVQQSQTNTTLTSFSLADNLLELTATTNAYFLQEVENQQFEIKFGDGVIGSALIDGNIVIVDYVISDGPAANGASSFSPTVPLAGYPANLTAVTTLVSAAGGLVAETTDEIRFSAPKNFETQKRAVTAADYVLQVTEQYSNADSVTVWGGEDNVPPQYGKVFISIKPVDGFVITEEAKSLVLGNLIRPINIVSVIPEFIDPDYTFINVNCTVKYLPANTFKTEGDIKSAAYNAIVNYAALNLDKFDLEFRYSKLLSAIDGSDVSITNNLTTIQIKKIFAPTLNVITNYTLNYYNPVVPGTLTSTNFIVVQDPKLLLPYVNGNTYSFKDDGNGNIQLIQQGIGTPNAVVRASCGTVNYLTGAITIQEFIPYSADVNGNVTITMTPQQNDIIPVRNNILFIKPADVSVTVLANA